MTRPSRAPALLLLLALLASACGTIVELELPELDAVPRDPPEQSLIFDADGNQLAVLRREFRERVAVDELPRHVLDAVVAAEDQRFWIHGGVDARAIVRAAAANLAAGGVEQGGSTITQQLVKTLYMPNDPRAPATKIREALLARQVEDEMPKEEILGEYLNTVYFGNGAYGIQAAAETYFRKEATALTLGEAALLAGIIRAPESLNPTREPDGAQRRRDLVLDAMVELGTAAPADAEAAKGAAVDVQPRPPSPPTSEPHWVDFVIRTLLDDPTFGDDEAARAQRLFGGGLRIHTTLRPELQALAREAVATHLPGDAGDPEVGLVHVDPATGHILASVGGRDYDEQQFDLATQARRQPGSAFKMFVLAAAVTSGYGPEDLVDGSPGTFDTPNGPWQVRNYLGSRPGRLTLEQATWASVNGAYARLILELGTGRVAALARAMGVRSTINEDAPIALGGVDPGVSPLDMAAAYATLANLGERVPATPISRIEDADGAVVHRPDDRGQRVLDPSAAYVTTKILQGVVEHGTGVRARIPGWEVAGKTGTTESYADAWFVGYTATLAASVWVGHPEGRVPMRNVRGIRTVTGGSFPARIWRSYATAALAGEQPVDFSLPEEYYEVVELDPASGLRAAPWCAGEPTAVPRVLVPRDTCPSPTPAPTRTGTPLPLCTPAAGPGSEDATQQDCVEPTPGPQPTGTGEPSPTPTGTAEPEPAPSAGDSPSEEPTSGGDGGGASPSPTEGGEVRDTPGGGTETE
ncbi:MAG: transglycosylase domain-containing protein [Actinobacteria bacterium]|nr:transglycosylase domain-containing protein [Actinomycetota bacterium]